MHRVKTILLLGMVFCLALPLSAKGKNDYFQPEGHFLYDESLWNVPLTDIKEYHRNRIKVAQDSAKYGTAAWAARDCIIANNNNPVDSFEVFCRATWANDGPNTFEPNSPLRAIELANGFTFLDSYYGLTGDETYEPYNESLKNRYTEWLAADYCEPLTEGFYFSEEQGENGSPKFILYITFNQEIGEWQASIPLWCSYNRAINILDLNISQNTPITVDDTYEIPRFVAVWGNQRVKEANSAAANGWFTSSYNFQRNMVGKIASKKWKTSDKTYATIATTAGGAILDGIGMLIANSGEVKETDVTLEWVPNGDGTLTAVVNKLVIINGGKRKNEINRFTLYKFYPHQRIAFYCKISSLNVHSLLNTLLYSKTLASDVADGTMKNDNCQIILRCFDPIRYNPFLYEGLKKKPKGVPGEIRYGECFPEFWKTLDQKRFNNAMYKSWALDAFFSDMPDEYRELLPKMNYYAVNGYVFLGDFPSPNSLGKKFLSKLGKNQFDAEKIWPKGFVAVREPNGNISYYYKSTLIEVQ